MSSYPYPYPGSLPLPGPPTIQSTPINANHHAPYMVAYHGATSQGGQLQALTHSHGPSSFTSSSPFPLPVSYPMQFHNTAPLNSIPNYFAGHPAQYAPNASGYPTSHAPAASFGVTPSVSYPRAVYAPGPFPQPPINSLSQPAASSTTSGPAAFHQYITYPSSSPVFLPNSASSAPPLASPAQPPNQSSSQTTPTPAPQPAATRIPTPIQPNSASSPPADFTSVSPPSAAAPIQPQSVIAAVNAAAPSPVAASAAPIEADNRINLVVAQHLDQSRPPAVASEHSDSKVELRSAPAPLHEQQNTAEARNLNVKPAASIHSPKTITQVTVDPASSVDPGSSASVSVSAASPSPAAAASAVPQSPEDAHRGSMRRPRSPSQTDSEHDRVTDDDANSDTEEESADGGDQAAASGPIAKSDATPLAEAEAASVRILSESLLMRFPRRSTQMSSSAVAALAIAHDEAFSRPKKARISYSKMKRLAMKRSSFLCEQCGKTTNERYGSGRFCSSKCARTYSIASRYRETEVRIETEKRKIAESMEQFNKQNGNTEANSALAAALSRDSQHHQQLQLEQSLAVHLQQSRAIPVAVRAQEIRAQPNAVPAILGSAQPNIAQMSPPSQPGYYPSPGPPLLGQPYNPYFGPAAVSGHMNFHAAAGYPNPQMYALAANGGMHPGMHPAMLRSYPAPAVNSSPFHPSLNYYSPNGPS